MSSIENLKVLIESAEQVLTEAVQSLNEGRYTDVSTHVQNLFRTIADLSSQFDYLDESEALKDIDFVRELKQRVIALNTGTDVLQQDLEVVLKEAIESKLN